MSTMHPGPSSRRLARETEQRVREEDRKGPPKEGDLEYLACKRRDYTFTESPVFSAHELSPKAILLRRQQREQYHAMTPKEQQAYCRDLDRRNEETWEVAELMGYPRTLRPSLVVNKGSTTAPLPPDSRTPVPEELPVANPDEQRETLNLEPEPLTDADDDVHDGGELLLLDRRHFRRNKGKFRSPSTGAYEGEPNGLADRRSRTRQPA